MNIDHFYRTAPGRALFRAVMKSGSFRLMAAFLKTGASRALIPGFIRKNNIDMEPFRGQEYASFADFFSRKKEIPPFAGASGTLFSLCDASLSVYEITAGLELPVKGSVYTLADLLPEPGAADLFRDGLCLIFRLKASDYHRFHAFDDLELIRTGFIPGTLHSVQPAACEQVPVYRLNRRWWSLLATEHFNTAAQIEIGAMLVGGVEMNKAAGHFRCGEEMGCFTLAGSTIILLLDHDVKGRLELDARLAAAAGTGREIEVKTGERIGACQK